MQTYIIRRLLQTVPILLGVAVIAFSMMHFMPGDAISVLLGNMEERASEELVAQLRELYGLDRSLPAQFFSYLGNALQGDLGRSILRGTDVSTLIGNAFPHTLQLAGLALVFAVVIGLTLGIVAAMNHRKWLDGASVFTSLVGVSMPEFWFALLAVYFLALQLPIFPTSGTGGMYYLILPAFVLGSRAAAAIARITRSSMLETLSSQYVVTAEAKGMNRLNVVGKHALRNALMPVVTLIGLLLGRLLGGTVVVEMIFNRQGLGRLVIDSILQKDVPVLQGTILVIAFIYVLLNIVVDISYAWLNPKIRYS